MYSFGLFLGLENIEAHYAYICREQVGNGALNVWYLLGRNEGILSKTLTAGSNCRRIEKKLTNGISVLNDNQFGILREDTGEFTLIT